MSRTRTRIDSPSRRRALGVYVCMMRAVNGLNRRTHAHLERDDLTVSQFAVLEALHHLGPLCQRELGLKILRSSNNMTTVIDNLERRGLVERRRGEADRRVKTVNLTRSGKRLIAAVFPRHAAVLERELSVLGAEEQKELTRLCRKLGLAGETTGETP